MMIKAQCKCSTWLYHVGGVLWGQGLRSCLLSSHGDACCQHDRLMVALLSVFLSHPLLHSEEQEAFCQCTSCFLTKKKPTRLSHPKQTHTHLGGCPKASDPEGRTQNLRKQLGVREVLWHCLLHCCRADSPTVKRKQISIWFPLFLCWQGGELASPRPKTTVLFVHKEERIDLF